MIALVAGDVAVRRTDHVVVETASGVGYRLAVSGETLRHVPAVGREVTLHAHTILRDDAIALFGFASEEERDLFLLLLGVQAVGPKVALAVLGGGSPRELLRAIAAGQRGIDCAGYTPQQVKGAVCGTGRAAKDQVGRMVQALLALAEPPTPDHAADALAVAICHVNHAPVALAVAR